MSRSFPGAMPLVLGMTLACLDPAAAGPGEALKATFAPVRQAAGDEAKAKLLRGRIFWSHPHGDPVLVPCTHLVKEHPAGDGGGRGPCLHPKVPQHGGGHTERVPCADPRHASTRGPCGGHDRTLPCAHLVSPHGGDDLPKVPCIHTRPQHPAGDPTGGTVDCVHDLPVLERDEALGLVFYDCDAGFRSKVKDLARRLAAFGARFASPRQLHVLNRKQLGNYPDLTGPEAAKDPFWSHFNPIQNRGRQYLQVSRGHDDGVIAHELGHAVTGDQCVKILTLGGGHSLTGRSSKDLAMAEGWAQFVKAALTLDRAAARPLFPSFDRRFDFEKGTETERKDAAGRPTSDQAVGPSQEIEFCVGVALWDMFDTHDDGADQGVALPFSDLFKVLSPTFATLVKGPGIPDFSNFVDRLAKNHPALAQKLKQIRDQHAP